MLLQVQGWKEGTLEGPSHCAGHYSSLTWGLVQDGAGCVEGPHSGVSIEEQTAVMQHTPRLELSGCPRRKGADVAGAALCWGEGRRMAEERSHLEAGFWHKIKKNFAPDNCLGSRAPSGSTMAPLMEVAGGFLWG